MPIPEFRSPVARAVIPVLGGIALFALIGGVLWGIATFISGGGSDASRRLAPDTFEIGRVERLAETVAEDGPLLFPELGTAIGARSIVVDHTGTVAHDGWRVYWAYPADRDATCVVEQVRGTSDFVDCDGRTIDVSELSPPDAGVFPIVRDRTTLIIDLRNATGITTP
ncbi:MAG TPA: hypothetical protein VLA10_05005 [Ilumatobacter sp.]|nr:hypothetical protein [Ilumatobacter sp.]